MDDTFNDTFRDCYRARLNPDEIQVGTVYGAEAPVMLSLGLPIGANLKRALASPPHGAILALDMTPETAAILHDQIRALFRKMDWPLPEESREQASFQRTVPTAPRRSINETKSW